MTSTHCQRDWHYHRVEGGGGAELNGRNDHALHVFPPASTRHDNFTNTFKGEGGGINHYGGARGGVGGAGGWRWTRGAMRKQDLVRMSPHNVSRVLWYQCTTTLAHVVPRPGMPAQLPPALLPEMCIRDTQLRSPTPPQYVQLN